MKVPQRVINESPARYLMHGWCGKPGRIINHLKISLHVYMIRGDLGKKTVEIALSQAKEKKSSPAALR